MLSLILLNAAAWALRPLIAVLIEPNRDIFDGSIENKFCEPALDRGRPAPANNSRNHASPCRQGRAAAVSPTSIVFRLLKDFAVAPRVAARHFLPGKNEPILQVS